VSLNDRNENAIIQFAAEVATPGWVGFGISASGAMIDTDSMIGWVIDSNNKVSATDRYNSRYAQPKIDASQDLFNISGTQGMLPVTPVPINPIYYNVPVNATTDPCEGSHHHDPDQCLPSSSSSSGFVSDSGSSSGMNMVTSVDRGSELSSSGFNGASESSSSGVSDSGSSGSPGGMNMMTIVIIASVMIVLAVLSVALYLRYRSRSSLSIACCRNGTKGSTRLLAGMGDSDSSFMELDDK